MIGTTIGHYRILSKLGSGGMGVVYEAEDLDLRRRVALKFLPDSLAQDPAALERFLLEARSASALNHPNICTIYAVEREADQHFISMELLEGDTLDRRILHQPLSVEALLDICIQVADALDTAHHRGIIHRDIKPGNIFITTSGRAKVVDFGLAKITKASLAQTIGGGGPTAAFATNPGSTVGTVAYMSPEQARGEDLDPRSDLFSFGAVMYQMASGVVPFEGNTSAVIFSGILEKPHPPLLDKNADLPPKLSEIVDRALEKDRDMRFQTAAEIRAELKRLKRDTTSSKTSIPAASAVRSRTAASPISSSSAILISEAKRHKTKLLLGVAVLAVLLVAAGFGIYSALRPKANAAGAHKDITIKRLTSGTKNMSGISISPDGKYIAYSQTDKGKNSLRLFQIVTGSNVQLVPETEDSVSFTSFSADGNFVYYVRFNSTQYAQGVLFAVPTLGGESRKLVVGIDSPATASPDGQHLVFHRLSNKQTLSDLVVTDADGSNPRVVASMKSDQYWFTNGASWSPDSRTLVAARMTLEGGLGGHIVLYDLKDNTSRVLTEKKWPSVSRVVWLHDGSGVVLSARENIFASGSQLWHLSYPEGQVTRITNDLNGYGTVSIGLSQDDKSLATVQDSSSSNVWFADGSKLRQVTSGGSQEGIFGVGVLLSGNILFSGPVDNGVAVMTTDADGNRRPLSRGVNVYQFATDSVGKRVVLLGLKDTRTGMWIMNADGTDLRELSRDQAEDLAALSPDGSYVLFGMLKNGELHIYRMDSAGGPSTQITPGQARNPLVAPDGKSFLAMYFDESQNRWRKALFDIKGGAPLRVFDLPETADWNQAKWSLDGKGMIYSDNKDGIGNLWLLPLAGGPAKQLTTFSDQMIFKFAVSPKPGQYALARGTASSDLILIQNFR